jgi:hypothetical protein
MAQNLALLQENQKKRLMQQQHLKLIMSRTKFWQAANKAAMNSLPEDGAIQYTADDEGDCRLCSLVRGE